jgi:regulator of protease activity HflC (stomatin/prohibitin superfamily)
MFTFTVLGVLVAIASVMVPKTAMRFSIPMRIAAVLLVLIGSAGSAIVLVPAGYRGVLLQFGAVKGVLTEGIHLVMPGINTVEQLEVRTQKEQAEASAASRDLQTVQCTVALNYHVEPTGVGHLYQTVGSEYRFRVIDPAVHESLKVVTARYTAEDLIRLRDKVKAEVHTELVNRLRDYHVVVEPNGVSLEFNSAIEQKQVAQQMAEKQKYILDQAKLEATTAITRARGLAESAKINAEAFQTQGGKLVLAKDWIEKWDGHLPTVQSGSGMIIDVRELLDVKGDKAK